jgi:hypothetical protein
MFTMCGILTTTADSFFSVDDDWVYLIQQKATGSDDSVVKENVCIRIV